MNNRGIGRLKSLGPSRCPIVNPTWSPSTAAAKHAEQDGRQVERCPGWPRSPGGEQERVAGEEEADQQPGLGEDDRGSGRSRRGAQVDQDRLGSKLSASIVESRCTTAQDRRARPGAPRRTSGVDRAPLIGALSGAATVPRPRAADQTGRLRDPARAPKDPRNARGETARDRGVPAKAKTIAGFLGATTR